MGSGHPVTVLYEIVPVGVPIDLPGVDPSKYQIPTQDRPQGAGRVADGEDALQAPRGRGEQGTLEAARRQGARAGTGDDFRFAAAAASFGMILRDSQFRGGDDLCRACWRKRRVASRTIRAATARSSSNSSSAPATSPRPSRVRTIRGSATEASGALPLVSLSPGFAGARPHPQPPPPKGEGEPDKAPPPLGEGLGRGGETGFL